MDTYLHSFSDRLLLAMLALYVGLLFGEQSVLHRMLGLNKPALWTRRLFAACGRKLNRAQRGDTVLRLRGALLVALVLALCLGIGVLIGGMAEAARWNVMPEVALMAYLLPMRASFSPILKLRRLLHEKKDASAGQLAASLGNREEESRDTHGAIRIGIEYLALQFATRIVAPVFWYLLLGLPGLLFVTALSSMRQLFGRDAAFGSATVRSDALLQWPSARIAALLIALAAAFSPGCIHSRALKGAAAGGASNRGTVLGAAAGALGITLAGPRSVPGGSTKDAWIDFGSARAIPADLTRALYLHALAAGLLLLLITALNLGL